MKQYIDGSLYPDVDDPSQVPDELVTNAEKAEYIHRVCSAWDFDVFPERETFALLRGWKAVFDEFPLNDSPAYHTFRRIFHWNEVPMTRNSFVRLTYEVLDRAEGRGPDPCVNMV